MFYCFWVYKNSVFVDFVFLFLQEIIFVLLNLKKKHFLVSPKDQNNLFSTWQSKEIREHSHDKVIISAN